MMIFIHRLSFLGTPMTMPTTTILQTTKTMKKSSKKRSYQQSHYHAALIAARHGIPIPATIVEV